MTGRVGLLGGTFDPIHQGHLHAAGVAARSFALDPVLFIPSYAPPHKDGRTVAPAEDRFRMVELACTGRPGFVPSRIEVEARETSYSIITLEKVRRLFPFARLFFIVGADAFREIDSWRDYERVLEECRWIVTDRPGTRLADIRDILGGRFRGRMRELRPGEAATEDLIEGAGIFLLPIDALDVSATEIRRRVREGESIAGLVPEAVAGYIRDRGLYRSE
jgi:nicotinate-nucleotide adenylyltransferase